MKLKVFLSDIPRERRSLILIAVLVAVLLIPTFVSSEASKLVSLENKYIKIFVNASPNETGRFALDVTAGDPERDDDDNKPLIYGHPLPWTSYTTIQINGSNYVFGKATSKRSGAGLAGGEIVAAPKLEDNKITMKCRYDKVVVDQVLDITRSPSTGLPDTARIRYIIKNEGSTPTEVGLRTALDTMIGSNDGAPFRVGEKEITYEYAMEPGEYPDFWQAFDSLESPSVVAQGTLKGGSVTTPNKVIFTNWGKAADNPWDIPLQIGTEFVRLGEDDLDSTVLMYWYPREIQPGEQIVITLYYGLGGVTFAPGKTFLGISAPAEIQYSGENSRKYTIVLYMEHQGETNARDVEIELELPVGFKNAGENNLIKVEELEAGITKQFSWEIQADGLYLGDTSFRIKVSGEGLEPNEVTRRIKIIPPPRIGATLSIPKLKVVGTQWQPTPLPVTIKLNNLDELTAYDVRANLISGEGLRLAPGEKQERVISDLEYQGQAEARWNIMPVIGAKTGEFKVVISGSNLIPLEIPGEITIPALPATLNFSVPEKLQVGQVFNCDLIAHNLYNAKDFIADIKYDREQLRLVHVSRGTMLVEDGQLSIWSSGTIVSKMGIVQEIFGKRFQPYTGETTTLVRLNFVVIGPGEGTIQLERLKIINSEGESIPYKFNPLRYKIEEVK
ncbi:MAG TPA: cohesin domain-containing protein [Bacillota bacterium]|jgi:hypothetical protein|nr:cohesin domain-containing protein [Bacillota bacterium]HOL08700.1 cohesin domain-containing protein [Bacillota bacterium]HPO96397.1 cohesin domain-containing protein [Bacillota bacterium]